MDYECDPSKAQANLRKHGVNFADEERLISLGMDAIGRLLVAVFTYRSDRIRIISSR